MRLLKWSCLLLLLVGCGPDADGAYFVWQSPELGIGLLPGEGEGYWTPEVFDTTGHYVIDGLEGLGLKRSTMEEGVQSVRVEGKKVSFQCVGYEEGVLCDGQEFGFKLRVAQGFWASDADVIVPMCVWRTALAHELIHFFLGYAHGDPDADHTWQPAWALEGAQLGSCP